MMDSISPLNRADALSLTALFFSWLSILCIFYQNPLAAILFFTTAFLFDILDGYVARYYVTESNHGRVLDSLVDICIYSIFSALFFITFLSPHIFLSVLVGFFILNGGILRLTRFVSEGILTDNNNRNYYRGVTTVHMSFAVIASYFSISIVNSPITLWGSGAFIFLVSITQLSNYKSYKITNPLFYLLLIGITVGMLGYFYYGNP